MTTPRPRRFVPLDVVHRVPTPYRMLIGGMLIGQPVRSKHACTCHGGRPGTRPEDTWKAWRGSAVAAIDAERLELRLPTLRVPVWASVTAVFKRPAKPRKECTITGVTMPYPFAWTRDRVPFVGRPDWDQVFKAGVDVFVQGGLLLDDQLVVGPIGGGRFYAAVGEEPRVEVILFDATRGGVDYEVCPFPDP